MPWDFLNFSSILGSLAYFDKWDSFSIDLISPNKITLWDIQWDGNTWIVSCKISIKFIYLHEKRIKVQRLIDQMILDRSFFNFFQYFTWDYSLQGAYESSNPMES
jgi:hypothetical protein